MTNNGAATDGRFDVEHEAHRDGGISTDDLTLEEPWDGGELDSILDDGADPGTCVESDDGDLLLTSNWHGTHVAGIIGATTDNGQGVAGVDQRAHPAHPCAGRRRSGPPAGRRGCRSPAWIPTPPRRG